MGEREWDEDEEKVQHDVHEPTTYELAEAELKAEERKGRYILKDMMGSDYDNYFLA